MLIQVDDIMKEALQQDCTKHAPGMILLIGSLCHVCTMCIKQCEDGFVHHTWSAWPLACSPHPWTDHVPALKWAHAGVNILSVRVTKPSIPDSIVANFKAMEEERTKELIAQARERVAMREAEIERTRAVMQVHTYLYATAQDAVLHLHQLKIQYCCCRLAWSLA